MRVKARVWRGSKVGRVGFRNANRVLDDVNELERELIYDRSRLPLPYSIQIASAFTGESEMFGDRRLYHPMGKDRPAVFVYGGRPRLQVAGKAGVLAKALPFGIRFGGSSRVLICVRRKMRREVMHALGVAGSRSLKPPRMNWTSEISCEG